MSCATSLRGISADVQQMMGPEAMGIQPVNVDWWSEKVCRNYLFGHCPHLIFGNTVSASVEAYIRQTPSLFGNHRAQCFNTSIWTFTYPSDQ